MTSLDADADAACSDDAFVCFDEDEDEGDLVEGDDDGESFFAAVVGLESSLLLLLLMLDDMKLDLAFSNSSL